MSYSAITNGEIDPDSPVTTSLATKFRDNPEAMVLGLAGATRIVDGAIAVGTLTAQRFADGAMTPVKFQNATAGDYDPMVNKFGAEIFTNTTYAKKGVGISMAVPGVYRVTLTLTIYPTGKTPGSTTIYGRIYVDGVATGTERSLSGTDTTQTWSEDITVAAGEEIQIYAKHNGSGSNVARTVALDYVRQAAGTLMLMGGG